MAKTTIFNIELPDPGQDRNDWGGILNGDSFGSLDFFLQQNPSQFLMINVGSGGGLGAPSTSGYLRISGGTDLVGHWDVQHSSSGSLDFIEYDGSTTEERFTIASGGDMYRYSSDESYGPGGIYIPLAEVDQIGDWIAVTTTSFTDVDLSDDGVPSGAVAAVVRMYGHTFGAAVFSTYARKNGSSDTTNKVWVGQNGTNVDNAGVHTFVIPLDSNLIFEANNGSSGVSAGQWEAVVLGYFI
jgi:hypothetical protein